MSTDDAAVVDLRSDTVTRPDERMREAARDADVGDDVYGEDPTVADLEARAADLLGTERALFFPSGTMANQAAVRVHTERGQEALVDRESHVYRWEVGGLAQHSALQVRTIDAARGVPTAEQVAAGVVEEDLHRPGTGLLALENTHNARGGVAIEPDALAAAAGAARERGVPVHLDGARAFNAAVALDVPVDRIADPADTVMISLSKGLGAPVGSVLAGSAEHVAAARRVRKLLGGGMRQAGIVAAPGLVALEAENVARLATDHANARALVEGVDGIEGLSARTPDTNVVLVGTETAAEPFVRRCADAGVRCTAFGDRRVRLCTHRDVDRADVELAVERIERAAHA